MSAQRAETTQDERERRQALIADWRGLQAEIAAANPDMTDEDWDRFADEWAEAVNEGLRNIVRRSRGEPTTDSQ